MSKLYALGLMVMTVALIGATTLLPLAKLTIDQRRQSLADSTVVTIGKKTVTLGVLRRAHLAREQFVAKAAQTGTALRRQFQPQNRSLPRSLATAPAMLPTATPTQPPLKASGAGHPVTLATPSRPSLNLSGLGKVLPNTVLEPSSQYASTPADMKAFCLNAWAAACLYLPPQQPAIQTLQGQLLATDTLIDQGQCSAEGGKWANYYGNVAGCGFLYPDSVTVHFTPATNYKLKSSAQCDPSWWTYTVDPHGAVAISLTNQVMTSLSMVGVWGYAGPSSGGGPWCLVYVTKGS